MKKKILSVAVAAAMTAACCGAVTAEEKTPSVYVDNSEIFFADQTPVILGEGTTLIPARGVFEAMGAKVDWDGEKRLVEVTSADNKTLIRLTIDDSEMKVYDLSGMIGTLLSGQDFKAPETSVTLTEAPQIINDRTMIPLRAISEALDADVDWDGEKYEINITTADYTPVSDDALEVYLSSSSKTAAKDETVDVYVNVKNIPENTYVSGVTATVKYDSENFEFVSSALINGDTVIENALGETNSEFGDGYLKTVYVTIDAEAAVKTDGAVMKLTFKALTGEAGEFKLSNGYQTQIGYNTTILLDSLSEGGKSEELDGNKLNVSDDVLLINSDTDTAEPEATAEPISTTEPEATAEPTSTTEPEATAEPTSTTEPESTEEPTSTTVPESTDEPTSTTEPEATETPAA